MAESNVIAPIFRWANGWIADDIFTGINNSYFYSENIEIRENSKWISLSKKLKQNTTLPSEIDVMTRVTPDLLVAGWVSGKIYKYDNSWEEVTTWLSKARYSAAAFNDYLYWCHNNSLYKVAISDIEFNSTVTPTKVADLDYSTQHPMLVSMWDLYIWNRSKLAKVDANGVFSNMFTLESWWIIVKLNDLWWTIRVITQSALWVPNIYLRNWVSRSPDETIPLTWYTVYQSLVYNWYPYIVTDKWLGILDWYRIYPLKKINDFAQIENWIWVYNEKLVIAGRRWVYSRWAKNRNYNEVLSYDYVANWRVTCLYSDWTDLFVAWNNSWSCWVDKLSYDYNTTGYLITRWYYANSLKEVKEWIMAGIWYSELQEWESIEIQYSVNWWAFTTLRTIDSTTQTIEKFTEDLFVRDRFQYIQFKIILNWNWDSTPSFYALDLLFNNNVLR
jgi:hypothetical protein